MNILHNFHSIVVPIWLASTSTTV